MKFLITGTGRCGTTYCAEILKACGVNCSHQQVFKHLQINDFADFDGGASYEAVPYLKDLKEKLTIIHIKRDRSKVIDSYMRTGTFALGWQQPYRELYESVKVFAPEVLKKKTELQRVKFFCNAWFNGSEKYADHSFDIETLDTKELFKVIGFEERYDRLKIDLIPKNINSH